MNQQQVMKQFSLDEEELLRAFLFTNPHGEEGFIYPQPLVAGEELSPLMSAVSRTHVNTQTRVLQFLDTVKPEQTRAFLPHVRPLMEIFRHPDGRLQVSRKTTSFNQEWAIAHGHGSIKEGTNLFGHCENISDIALKSITGHPANHPQGKSTRYINYATVLPLALQDPDIRALPDADRFLRHLEFLHRRYHEVTAELTDRVAQDPLTAQVIAYLRQPALVEREVGQRLRKKQSIDPEYAPTETDRSAERAKIMQEFEDVEVRKALGKFVLDSSRVYLPAATRSSLVFSADARTLEEIITTMISNPRIEDQQRGRRLWAEAKKLSPVLLGEKGHIAVDTWRIRNEQELRAYCEERCGSLPLGQKSLVVLHHSGSPRLQMASDRFNAALIAFQYTNASLIDLFEHLSDGDVKEVLHRAHHHRGERDILHPAISHNGLVFELTMGYHGYRDLFRHRRGSRATQLLTTRLGFETPAVFPVYGLDKSYEQDMQASAAIYEAARVHSRHTAEKLVPFGARCSALHNWDPRQVGYITQLRSKMATGNESYVRVARALADALAVIMPQTTQFMRVDRKEYPPNLWKRGYGWYDQEQRGVS